MNKMMCVTMALLSVVVLACGKKSNIPEWVLNPPVAEGALYGIGSSSIDDDNKAAQMAKDKASISAVLEHSFRISDPVETETFDFLFAKAEQKSITLNWFTDYITIIRLEKATDGTWWCLAVYEPLDAPDNPGTQRVFEMFDTLPK